MSKLGKIALQAALVRQKIIQTHPGKVKLFQKQYCLRCRFQTFPLREGGPPECFYGLLPVTASGEPCPYFDDQESKPS